MKIVRILTLRIEEGRQRRKTTNNVSDVREPSPSPEEAIERAMATRIPHLAMEMDTNILELKLTDEVYKVFFYIFQLYGVLMKPLDDGVEIDLREREAYEPDYYESDFSE